MDSHTLRQVSYDPFSVGDFSGFEVYGLKDWRRYASMGLLGICDKAIAGLSEMKGRDAEFYLGVSLWMDGRDDEALKHLSKVDSEHADNLRKLIGKKSIDVLAQLSWARAGFANILGGLKDPKFHLKNISFHQDDLRMKPYGKAKDIIPSGFAPQFYIAEMIEWHIIPYGLRELGCPIFGETSDYDVYGQACLPLFNFFDEFVVLDSQERQHVSAITKRPAWTFPKSVGLPDLPGFKQGKRELDLFYSGSTKYPYYASDKAALFMSILAGESPLRLYILSGFMKPEDYYKTLASTKASFCSVRRPATLPSRGLESLAMGCATIVQEGSVLSLFSSKEEGLLTYKTGEDLYKTILDVSRRWPEFEQAALKGSASIRKQFALERVSSQYLRFLTFLAAKPRPNLKRELPEPPFQKKITYSRGYLPGSRMDRHNIFKKGLKVLGSLKRHGCKKKWHIDFTREILGEYMESLAFDYAKPGDGLLSQIPRLPEPPPLGDAPAASMPNGLAGSIKSVIKKGIRKSIKIAPRLVELDYVAQLPRKTVNKALTAARDVESKTIMLLKSYYDITPAAIKFQRKTLKELWAAFSEGTKQFPKSLALQFNQFRTICHYGDEAQVEEAIAKITPLLCKELSDWDLESMDDVLPWDFFPTTFNYRAYLDTTIMRIKGELPNDGLEREKRLILASAHHYVGCITADSKRLKTACELDPDFPYYKLAYAISIEDSNPTEAAELLSWLCKKTMLYREAIEELKKLEKKGLMEEGKLKSASSLWAGDSCCKIDDLEWFDINVIPFSKIKMPSFASSAGT